MSEHILEITEGTSGNVADNLRISQKIWDFTVFLLGLWDPLEF